MPPHSKQIGGSARGFQTDPLLYVADSGRKRGIFRAAASIDLPVPTHRRSPPPKSGHARCVPAKRNQPARTLSSSAHRVQFGISFVVLRLRGGSSVFAAAHALALPLRSRLRSPFLYPFSRFVTQGMPPGSSRLLHVLERLVKLQSQADDQHDRPKDLRTCHDPSILSIRFRSGVFDFRNRFFR